MTYNSLNERARARAATRNALLPRAIECFFSAGIAMCLRCNLTEVLQPGNSRFILFRRKTGLSDATAEQFGDARFGYVGFVGSFDEQENRTLRRPHPIDAVSLSSRFQAKRETAGPRLPRR